MPDAEQPPVTERGGIKLDRLAPVLYAAMARAVAEWGWSVPDWDDVLCANSGILAAARVGWLAAAGAAREQVVAEVEAERERVRSAAEGMKVTLTRPGNGPAHAQAVEVVPLPALLRLLGPEPGNDGREAVAGTRIEAAGGDETPPPAQALSAPEVSNR